MSTLETAVTVSVDEERNLSENHITNVKSEYDQYCSARKRFLCLKPNWVVYIVSTLLAIGALGYAVSIAKQDIVVALGCVSGAMVILVGLVLFEQRRVHQRMEALAEMRLKGKTFNF